MFQSFLNRHRPHASTSLNGLAVATLLILGAGLAGMTAALELRNAAYKVEVLGSNSQA
jgi:monoamine oxidase